MAEFTRTHGNAQNVFHMDIQEPVTGNAANGEPTNSAGPKYDFFGMLVATGGAAVDLRQQMGTGLGVEAILQQIQTKGTIAQYQVENASTGSMSVAVYPSEAYTAASLQTDVRTLTSAGSTPINCNQTTVTDVGFKLATS
jgi:hypothetical protein